MTDHGQTSSLDETADMTAQDTGHESGADIAIVAMASRLPDATDPDEFWENLRRGHEAVRTLTDEQLEAAGVPAGLIADPSYVKCAMPLDDFDMFDAEFFGMGPKDAAIMDPQHRVLLEVAWEALERAGHLPEAFDGDIGVFAGCGMGAYFIFNVLTNPDLVDQAGLFLLRHTGNDKDFLATRVSYALNLTGPSVNVQTACSTSLVAIHQACQSLLQYECDLALAGGVTIELPQGAGYLYREGEPASPDGHCRAFDHRSAGTVFGSGAGLVALRRLSDALADGDEILGIVKGSAINNDGSGKVSYLAPSVDGQAAAIAEALAVADVAPETVQYVEAHGTGTPLGDPIEVAALNEAFGPANGPGTIGLGSVKPNIGHLDTAAGIAGFIKLVQAIRHREIPPSINFEAPNPALDFASGPFHVIDRLTPWPDTGDLPARGGISSLGVGGTNAHVVVEEAPPVERSATPPRRRGALLRVSGRNNGAVGANSDRIAELLDAGDADLHDVAYSLHRHRHPFDVRRTVVAVDPADAAERLRSGDATLAPTRQVFHDHARMAWLFPGGGSQYPGMGRDLYQHEPVYRQWVDAGLERLDTVHSLDLRPLLFPEPGEERQAAKLLEPTDRQLPAIFITEFAMAKLLESMGLVPASLAGHSLGELTAACYAGVVDYDDCLDLVLLRGQLFAACDGGVLSVQLDPDELQPHLFGTLVVATINAPGLSLVSGSTRDIADLAIALADAGVEIRELPLATPAHSPLLDPILPAWEERLRTVTFRAPAIPMASNLTGGWLTAEEATDPDYWVRHLRNTVRFADNAELLLAEEGTVLVEVGPGRALSSFVRASAAATPQQPVLQSMRHPEQQIDDDLFVLDMVGRLWAAGVDVDADVFYEGEQRRRVALPTYAFQRQRYFIEPGERVASEGSGRSALHRSSDVADWFYEIAWHEEPQPAPGGDEGPHRWLVFEDRVGVGAEMVERLRADGHEVISVIDGDSHLRLGPDRFVVAPEVGVDGYRMVLSTLAGEDRVPDRVLHLWSVSADKQVRAGSSWYHHVQERGFLSLVHLAQAVGQELTEAPPRWTVVTNDALGVNGPVEYPEKATLMGPVEVIPHELQGVEIGVVDIEVPKAAARGPLARVASEAERLLARAQGRSTAGASAVSDIAALLARDLGSAETAVVGYRNGRRYVRSIDHVRGRPNGAGARLRAGGVYLITGGLGGLAMSLAQRLGRSWNAKLVLVGRSGVPDRGQWDAWLAEHGPGNATSKRIRKLLALEEAGVEYLVAGADVADIEAMERVVTDAVARFGRIDGVLHAAGLVEENLIALKTDHEIDRVLTPKVQGAMVLDRVLAPHKPDFIVYFSSTSTVLGIPGQVDYAAANAFLDGYAACERRPGDPERISLAWGPWREVGLAAESNADLVGDAFEPSGHPLLDFVSVDDEYVVGTLEMSADTMWVLDEHRSEAGRAVLPGTGHLELLVSTALASGASGVQVDNVTFVAPLTVPDSIIRDGRVVLERQGDSARARVETAAQGSASGWLTHSEATVRWDPGPAPAPLDLDAVTSRCTTRIEVDAAGIRTRQEDHINFGPRWRNLRSIRWGDGEALAEVALDPGLAADTDAYNLHPAMLDMATGFGLPLVEGYGGDHVDLYVPMSYGSLRWHAPLPAQFFSHLRLRDVSSGANLVRFDITLVAEDGTVLVDIENLAIVKVADGERFGETPASGGALGAVADVDSPEVMFQRFLDAGIQPDEGWTAFERVLELDHGSHVFVSPLPITGQIAVIDATLAGSEGGARFERPNLASEYREPDDETERGLVQIWEELLGVDPIGVDDDFFELGGHSLIALRLFAAIKQRFGVDQPMSVLFDASTVAKLADFIRAETGDADGASAPTVDASVTSSMRHVVQMSPAVEDGGRPFFLVAGMFGNILNLRHLAMLLGTDRAVYGIQARGLRDDEEPHDRFEDMASAYIEEVRQVQPHGPYFLGGFSGGGIVAYEMAHQLLALGEETAMIAMLDTPVPGLSARLNKLDRALLHAQRFRDMKLRYPAYYLREKREWRARQSQIENPDFAEHEFRSTTIVDAFNRAVRAYEPPRYDGEVHMYRPPMHRAFRITGQRYINPGYQIQVPDNGWTPYVRELFLRVVPGDHDSMVLEPNVRVLASQVVADLAEVERSLPED